MYRSSVPSLLNNSPHIQPTKGSDEGFFKPLWSWLYFSVITHGMNWFFFWTFVFAFLIATHAQNASLPICNLQHQKTTWSSGVRVWIYPFRINGSRDYWHAPRLPDTYLCCLEGELVTRHIPVITAFKGLESHHPPIGQCLQTPPPQPPVGIHLTLPLTVLPSFSP